MNSTYSEADHRLHYVCPTCGAANPFVNRCGCDKANLPTKVPTGRETFLLIYTEALRQAVTDFPLEYNWPIANVPIVVERMAVAIDRNTFSHHSRAFRTTCKALGIPHTRKAILAYWKGGAR